MEKCIALARTKLDVFCQTLRAITHVGLRTYMYSKRQYRRKWLLSVFVERWFDGTSVPVPSPLRRCENGNEAVTKETVSVNDRSTKTERNVLLMSILYARVNNC